MKFDGVKKVDEGRFISRYNLYYTTEDDKKKVYEIISRNKDIKTLEDIRNEKRRGTFKGGKERVRLCLCGEKRTLTKCRYKTAGYFIFAEKAAGKTKELPYH